MRSTRINRFIFTLHNCDRVPWNAVSNVSAGMSNNIGIIVRFDSLMR